MVNLSIEETSGVDHPAHLHEGWLVIKSANDSEVQRVLNETLTEEDSNMEKNTNAATDEQVEVVSTESNEVEKAGMTLEEALKKIADLQAKLVELEGKESEKEMEKSETVADDFMKSAPEAVVKMIDDLRKQATEATEALQKERDARADAEAIEKAKAWGHLSLDAEKIGPALRRLASVDADLAKSIEETLSSVNAQAESANIFAEIGKSADFKTGNAYEQMTALAKSAVEGGTAKTIEQALANVAVTNPDLYSQYLSEKGA